MNFIYILKALLQTFAPTLIDLLFSFFAPSKEEVSQKEETKTAKKSNPKMGLIIGTGLIALILAPLAGISGLSFYAGLQVGGNCTEAVVTKNNDTYKICIKSKEKLETFNAK